MTITQEMIEENLEKLNSYETIRTVLSTSIIGSRGTKRMYLQAARELIDILAVMCQEGDTDLNEELHNRAYEILS